MKPLSPNTLLQNRYLVVELIGKGGMGEVYLAVDQRLGSAVALKRTLFSENETLGNAFEREARTLARLRHPVLPKVSDHFIENEMQYLVMEYITGDDLAKRLEITKKPFPLNWVLFWADQLLDALAYLHGYEPPIIHRDIKPQNLKLTDENHVVLLDFGLAKHSFGNTLVTTTTGGKSVVGYTPHYAPMEQIRGMGTNPRSDLYSLSATIYQLLTDTVPPDALTRADSVLNGLPDPIKPLTETNAEVPKTISDIVLKGMSLGLERRYPNAREMQKDLRAAYAAMQNSMTAETAALRMPSGDQTQPIRDAQISLPNDYQPAAQNLISTPHSDKTTADDMSFPGIKTNLISGEKLPAENSVSLKSENKFDKKSEDRFDKNESSPASVSAGTTKKSSGKAMKIAGGIGGFAVIAAVGAAIGWYMLKTPETKGKSAPALQVEATVKPAVELPASQTDTSSNSSATEASAANTATGGGNPVINNSLTDAGVSRSNTQPVIKFTPTPRAVTFATPRNAPPKTSSKTPARADRTDILQ